MVFKLFLIFTIVPTVELALLIYFGSLIGVLNTILIVILTAVVGSFMVKMEGLSVLYRFQRSVLEGHFPAEELFDGAMILVSGALLLTPGFVTDVLGFLFVFPSSRGVIKEMIKGYVRNRYFPSSRII